VLFLFQNGFPFLLTFPKGVLGQSANIEKKNLVGTGPQAEGLIDGEYQDYLLQSNDIFGDDFVFNKYIGVTVGSNAATPEADIIESWTE